MIPPAADNHPDPSSQVPWPTRGRGIPQTDTQDDQNNANNNNTAGSTLTTTSRRSNTPPGRRQLSLWELFTLSVSMAGAQITWTVELGYGTPYLSKLGLKEQYASLVWLAGPVSGLVAQPVIGALSDSSTSKYRRRFWIFLSTIALVLSMLTLAYSEALASFIVDLLAIGSGDWSEKREEMAKTIAITIAVIAFWILDFALNGLQASLRNLLLDVTPPGQLNAANAWHGRMINAGSIIGFGFGFLPLKSIPLLGYLGQQFTIFCLIATTVLVLTVVTTCLNHEEEARPEAHHTQRGQRDLATVFKNLRSVALNLPKPIRRVCYVQLLAWMGWFPFLFFATTYMGQVMAHQLGREPDQDQATRLGELAMAIHSIVAVVAGIILPRFAARDRRLMGSKSDVSDDAELSRLRTMVRQWRVEAAQQGKPLRLPVMPFLLRNIWTGALLFFAALMLSTFFIETTTQAAVFISALGICWAVTMWVPFTIIMELLKEPPPRSVQETRRPVHARNLSTPGHRPSFTSVTERQPLLRRRSFDEYAFNPDEDLAAQAPSSGGTILGIHNLAIVIPQFIVALVTSVIFRIVDGNTEPSLAEPEDRYYGKNGVAWALRFGGTCAILAALMARRVPPTPTEKAMRRRLGEMQLLGEQYT